MRNLTLTIFVLVLVEWEFLQNFSGEEPDASVFGVYKSLDCHGFPGPGSDSDQVYIHNPMREFIGGHTQHVDTRYCVINSFAILSISYLTLSSKQLYSFGALIAF